MNNIGSLITPATVETSGQPRKAALIVRKAPVASGLALYAVYDFKGSAGSIFDKGELGEA